MKKLISSLLVLVILTGCAGQAKIKPATNELFFTINGKEITEKDTFEAMRLSQGSVTLVQQEAQKILLEKLVVEDEAFDKVVESTLKEAKELMGENFDLTLKQNGFDSEEQYIEEVVKNVARVQIVITQAMEKDYAELAKKRPRKVRLLEVKQSDSKTVVELAKAGQSLEELSKEYALEETDHKGQEILVSEISTVDTNILEKALAMTETGLVEEAVASKDGTSYYVAEVVELDTEVLKEEALEHFSQDNTLSKTYLGQVFKDNNFKIYDQDIYNGFVEQYPEYIK